jgi:hypothetical protein
MLFVLVALFVLIALLFRMHGRVADVKALGQLLCTQITDVKYRWRNVDVVLWMLRAKEFRDPSLEQVLDVNGKMTEKRQNMDWIVISLIWLDRCTDLLRKEAFPRWCAACLVLANILLSETKETSKKSGRGGARHRK